MINYAEVIARYRIEPKGVVHVGGYVGDEEEVYKKIGFANRLFIEAQPDTFRTLSAKLAKGGAHCENVAVSDRTGTAMFHEAVNGQSSSILRLKRHLDVYPDIVETKSYEVATARLDDVLNKPTYVGLDFNFLNIDIQGAEMLALAGGTQTLRRMQLLNLEINFDELYEGAPHVSDLDAFLSAFGFVRADTFLWHASWGDAIWVRRELARAS